MKICFRQFICLPVLLFLSTVAFGQRISEYQLRVGGLASSGGQTPFWLRANQYGTVPLRGSTVQVAASLYQDYLPTDSAGYRPKADWGYGISAVVNAGAIETRPAAIGSTGTFLLPEAYVKGRFGAFELYVGRRRETFGLNDTLLTTGSYAWSGNALPLPKIQIALPDYTAVPFTKGVLSVLGGVSHGWFEKSGRLVRGSYLHHKYVYGRIGKPTWSFRLYGGFNHNVIWAGEAAPGVLSPAVSIDNKLPSSIRYFPAVFLGTRGLFQEDNTLTSFEDNRIGNHLGSVDLGADIDVLNWNVFLYRQFPYDDGSLFYLTNVKDGLNGLRLKNQGQPDGRTFFLRQLTLEYLFTGSQGGDEFVIEDPLRRGRDDYFNHSQFVDGWRYFGRTIGNPLLTPNNETDPSLPQRGSIANNRVSALHLGISGQLLSTVDLTAKLTLSRNAGTYPVPYLTLPTQFSGLLMASVPVDLLGGVVLNGSVALDMGGLLPNSVGAYVGLRKTGVLHRAAKPASKPLMRF